MCSLHQKNKIADAIRSFLFLNRRVLPSPTPAPPFGLIRHLPTTATFVRKEQPEVLPETKNAESFGESGAYPGFGIRSRCRLLPHEPCISGMRSRRAARSRRDLARRRSEGDTLPVATDTTSLPTPRGCCGYALATTGRRPSRVSAPPPEGQIVRDKAPHTREDTAQPFSRDGDSL